MNLSSSQNGSTNTNPVGLGDDASDSGDDASDSGDAYFPWDASYAGGGHKVPPSGNGDEDGRSDQERLMDEGIADAELDQIAQASRLGEEDRGET